MKTLTDMFEPYRGVHEYDGIVHTMLAWYYGKFKEKAWCAISMSYMADKLGILDQFGGKNQNCYRMLTSCEAAVKKTGKGKVTYASGLKGKRIKRGTVIFMLRDDPPMTVESTKHVTTAYEDFTYEGKGYFTSLGGNQSDEIQVKRYTQKTIYAIFEPEYDKSKHKTLRKGDKGNEVKELQTDLNYLGFRDGTGKKLVIDGSFGSKTQAALKNLQEDQALKVDGVCGPLTWGRIDELLKKKHKVRTTTKVWLRTRPEKIDETKIKVLPKGLTAYCSRESGEWSYLPEQSGWSMTKYLENI